MIADIVARRTDHVGVGGTAASIETKTWLPITEWPSR
jgi:hypothetical protein